MTGFLGKRSNGQGRSAQNRASVKEFEDAQRRLLERFGLRAESRFVDVPAIGGRAHLLVVGEGPPLMMVIGGMVPAAFWAPLMPHLTGYTLYAVDLPGFGLTDGVDYSAKPLRSLAVEFLAQVLGGVGLQGVPFITQSQGSLWSAWLSLDHPGTVDAQVMVACPAHILGTTAHMPMRVMSISAIGRMLMTLQTPSHRQVDRVFAMVHEDVSGLGEVRDVLLACEQLPTYVGSFVGLLGAVMRFGRIRPEISLTGEQLADIRHPVQMIWGEDDPFGSVAVARRAMEFIPNGELNIVGGGHAPWFDQAEQVGDIAMRFLREHRRDGEC
ncbi:4,5:9,10-diseco-3-hydroxy-5,9,17-trioxoandrosta-1(10),2-diene-4-oate hydrolase [Mycobacterium marinum]|uniref:4,5:9,10-diseco-3-hydroxy-5,9, 17-trioxoandrosta-1(10),2-diene-4-oate hydrolase n=1 Tax=Mycobacterium marinum TaxID=1781 RepID=A0A3E2MW11_MYCMR|nr:alpha/beta hydrolase [Mycobacterium marinum]RFZ41334.1 4,5:9,10-diseco-3-hydroxy-5,9,17-trioxoandrosta-1(10),2-diene-4-oate hydrolase [Mycobacterium marinum]GJO50106.1 hypothetical protein NJB1604_35430 [Mycobacterium marinum]